MHRLIRSNLLGYALSMVHLVTPSPASPAASLFPLSMEVDDIEWNDISPADALRIVEESKGKRQQYGTCRAQVLVYGAYNLASSRTDVVEIFRRITTADDAPTLRTITSPILRHLENFNHKLNWAKFTVVEDGDDVVERCLEPSSASVYLDTSDIKVVYEGLLRQVDIALPGLQNRTLVHTFASYWIPLERFDIRGGISTAISPGLLKLTAGSANGPTRTSVYSRDSKIIVYDKMTSASGVIESEAWQSRLDDYTPNRFYPTALLRIGYQEGRVNRIDAVVLKSVEYDIRIDPDEFAVAIPAGTTVVDTRDGEPEVIRMRQPTDNLLALLDAGLPMESRTDTQTHQPSDRTMRWRTVLIVINTVVVVILLAALSRRMLTSRG